MSVTKRRMAELVREDKAIEKQASSATLALMEHRWKAVQEIGSVAEYAAALGLHQSGISKYVRGWELWQRRSSDATYTSRTPQEILDLASMGETKRAAMEAVADAKGIGVVGVRQRHREQARRVEEIIREKGPEEGRRVARVMEEVRQQAHEDRETRKSARPLAYIELEADLGRARQALTTALTTARAAELDNELQTGIRDMIAGLRFILELIDAALSGGEGVDWDSELAKLRGDAS